ncbi:MAG: hypothetical protein LQ351_003749 [Letrouitia transgressa]|nr:MAG: hypothetical protein LQ351_003749 [Letrouitia transgressa]
MPPFVPSKRSRSSPPGTPLCKTSLRRETKSSLQDNKRFLNQLDDSSSDTTLSDISSAEFEDVQLEPSPKRRKLNKGDHNDDGVDWEDVVASEEGPILLRNGPTVTGDLEITFNQDYSIGTFSSALDKKKGPSKIERQIRVATHCMHVQFLLFHNLTRSRFACDAEVHKILLSQLPPTVKKEYATWRLASGMPLDTSEEPQQNSLKNETAAPQNSKHSDIRSQRDWGKPADRQENGAANLSRADPLIRFLKILAAYWRKRFTVTAPSLRKQGYKPLAVVETEIQCFKKDSPERDQYSENLNGLEGFRKCARKCTGSRDMGVQLFVALIRALGIETRLVASLQPLGFGWGKYEEAPLEVRNPEAQARDQEESAFTGSSEEDLSTNEKPNRGPGNLTRKGGNKSRKSDTASQGTKMSPAVNSKGRNEDIISIPSSSEDGYESTTQISTNPRSKMKKLRDRTPPFPTYWAEAISPITSEVYPVDFLNLKTAVATNSDHLVAYEPKGTKADLARQIFAYVVAFSPDGTAKDVTTRYLKGHVWPGRTRKVRYPVEKVPVLDRSGRVKKHEDFDWFAFVMRSYARRDGMRTAVDDIEEAKELVKAVRLNKKQARNGSEETLQSYKKSEDFVLERFLRREEAIVPGALPVKTFTTGKGDKAKDEPVFRRADVRICRTGESWHKEGRQVKAGELPMKLAPIRAVTLTRKREVEEAERDGGEKLKQGLYSLDQTEWIIPPPIANGVIPKNAFGNIDCFVPSMVPKGATHIPLKGTVRICKRLDIDFAEAVIGFEFGNQRAVPVISGVVVAAENEGRVLDEWEKDEEARRVKEESKREKMALSMWRKMLTGLRIIERVRDEYGEVG